MPFGAAFGGCGVALRPPVILRPRSGAQDPGQPPGARASRC